VSGECGVLSTLLVVAVLPGFLGDALAVPGLMVGTVEEVEEAVVGEDDQVIVALHFLIGV